MKKTQLGLWLCLSILALSFLVLPAQKSKAALAEATVQNAITDGLFVTYQKGASTATRQLSGEASAEFQEAHSNAELQEIFRESSVQGASKSRNGLYLILRGTSGLESNAAAKAALQRAAGKWEYLIQDQISVAVDVDFGARFFDQVFPANAVALTQAQGVRVTTGTLYERVIGRMRDNATEERQKVLLNSLPDTSLPTDIGGADFVVLASPIARAIGNLPADADPNNPTEQAQGDLPAIGFNSAIKFDFDPSDGIDADKIDFEALATRELGRIIGFTSNTGSVELDAWRATYLTVWDFFRFRPGLSRNAIASTPRPLLSGGEHVFFTGGEEYPLSTARADGVGGDGNPAPHWKDDALTGRYIGIMDPTLALGERGGITSADIEALSAMSYAVPFDAPVIEVLSVDDNSREETIKLNGALAVTRLTPSRYPAELQSIRIQLPPTADASSLAGTQLRLVAFVDPGRSGRPIVNPDFLVNRTITIQNIPENRMLEVMIPNAPIISEGDLYIGAQSASSTLLLGADRSSLEQHSFLSTNNGASFQPLLSQAQTGAPLNLILRAVLSERTENLPVPAVNFLSPSSAMTGEQEFTLTISGKNFLEYEPGATFFNSTVRWNGEIRQTTHLNDSTLQIRVLARDLAQASTAKLTVFTKTPEKEFESAPFEFKIAAENPKPVAQQLSPDEGTVGGGNVRVTVFGRNFTSASVMRWNGASRLTTFTDSTQLSINVTKPDLANAANAEISVFTPGPGGGESSTLKFVIAPCQYGLALSKSNYSALGDTGGILVSTGKQCSWTTKSNDSWIRLQGAASRTGTSFLVYTLTQNTTSGIRSGSLTVAGQTIPIRSAGRMTAVSATNYYSMLAPDSIIALFGLDLANSTQIADSKPLPANLSGTEVQLTDYAGQKARAPLFYVSPTQINFKVPQRIQYVDDPVLIVGKSVTVEVYRNGELVANGFAPYRRVAPGLFTMNSDLLGPPAGTIYRVKADGSARYEPISEYDPVKQRFVAKPISFGDETDQVYLLLFCSGVRGRKQLSSVTVKIGSTTLQPIYAGSQGDFEGLDQVNVLLPRTLQGSGEVRLVLTAEGLDANQVRIMIQ